jgi:hypothetical protein
LTGLLTLVAGVAGDLDAMAASMQGTAVALEKKLQQDSLKHQVRRDSPYLSVHGEGLGLTRGLSVRQLEKRPTFDDVKSHHMVEDIAPALASTAKQLEHSLHTAQLSRSLGSRPDAADLVQAGIMDGTRSPRRSSQVWDWLLT